MKPLFHQCNTYDQICKDNFDLNEDILMENASNGINLYIRKKFKKNTSVLIVCGSGNNGADGITLARQLHKDYNVSLFMMKKPSTKIGEIQLKRATLCGVKPIDKLSIDKNSSAKTHIIVDCIFGTGLNKTIDKETSILIDKLNNINAFKISCDVPSGLFSLENLKTSTQKEDIIFKADTTITMGALKTSLYGDKAKDFTGKIKLISLGISNKIYAPKSNIQLLCKKDLKLPFRNKKNTHKGDFGHCCVLTNNKENSHYGAPFLALKSAMEFGAGLCTIISKEKINLDIQIMSSNTLPKNCNALAMGMGLGEVSKEFLKDTLNTIKKQNIKTLLDADMFYKNEILDFFKLKDIVITPHPKEFISLLKICNLADISIDVLQENRFYYCLLFSQKYPNITLLLKGANTLIAKEREIYVQPHGSSKLSKGGMGDVLSGIILSYLAQGYDTLQSAINSSLAFSLCAKKYKKNDYSFTPLKLIKMIKKL